MALDWSLPDLRNTTLDHISRYLAKASVIFRHRQITTIYKRIKDPEAPLRRFAVDHFVHSVMKKSVPAETRQLYLANRLKIDDSAFLYEVIEAMIGAKRYPVPVDPENKGLCAYHEHLDGVRCEVGLLAYLSASHPVLSASLVVPTSLNYIRSFSIAACCPALLCPT